MKIWNAYQKDLYIQRDDKMKGFSFRDFIKKNNYKKKDSNIFFITSAICFLTALSAIAICLNLSNISIQGIVLLMFCADVFIVYGATSLVLAFKVKTYIRLAEFEEYIFEDMKNSGD